MIWTLSAAKSGIEGGKQAGWTRADDGDVVHWFVGADSAGRQGLQFRHG